jgi:gliding motility-associated-like protein
MTQIFAAVFLRSVKVGNVRSIFILLLNFISAYVFAQRQTQNWYFGRNAGLSFATPPPAALTNGALNTFEGCATFSDDQGNLLFYTDGINVYNKNHQRMPNGVGLLGNPSSAQSGIIVPNGSSTTKYYIFTVDAEGGGNGLRYSEVDLSLDGGLGDVMAGTKNTPLFSPAEEKIAAVRHPTITGAFWVIAHGFNNNRFYSYLVNGNVIGSPVISNIGATASGGWGYLAISPNGSRLACAYRNQGFELYDFNSNSGVVSNPLLLNNQTGCYGVSFSPNNSILYGCNIESGAILQWNLNAGSTVDIVNSVYQVGIGQGGGYRGGAIQLGLDNKLYIPHYEQPYLSVINSPNMIGAGCNLQHSAINLQGRNASLGLPPFIQSYLCTPPTIAPVANQTVNAGSQTAAVNFQPSSTNAGYQWMSVNNVSSSSASGVGQNGITFNVTQSGGGMGPHNGMYAASRFPPQYNVPQTAVTIMNTAAGVFTATFSQPVTNPLVAFASVGRPGLPVPVVVSRPFTPIWTDAATPGWSTTYDLPNNKFTGEEGFNIIRLDGTFTTVSFNYTVAESYCTVAFGFEDQNVSYSWTNDMPSIGLASSGTGNILPFTAINNTSSPIVATITATPVSGSCVGVPTVFTITVNPTITTGTISGNQTICVAASTQFTTTGTSGGTWSSSNSAVAVVNSTGIVTGMAAGTASIAYTIGGSSATRSIVVSPLPAIHAGPDLAIGSGGSVQMQASIANPVAFSYSWLPPTYLSNAQILQPVASPPVSTSYVITATDVQTNCKATDTMLITVYKGLYIPTAFTPNRDGKNDVWRVFGLAMYPNSILYVFDRAGQLMFSSDQRNPRFWDGTYKGQLLPNGVYVYMIDLKDGSGQVPKGTVSIIY